MSQQRRSVWRLSTGGSSINLRRRSSLRRSRTTSLLSSEYICLRYPYRCRFGRLRDTMKTNFAMIASRWLCPVPTQGTVHATAFVAIVRRRRDRRDGRPIRRTLSDRAGEYTSAYTQHMQTGRPQTGRKFLDFATADTWWFPLRDNPISTGLVV